MFDLKMYYYLISGDGMGNSVWQDNLQDNLKNIRKLLTKKYGDQLISCDCSKKKTWKKVK
jgi:hypothetical protein